MFKFLKRLRGEKPQFPEPEVLPAEPPQVEAPEGRAEAPVFISEEPIAEAPVVAVPLVEQEPVSTEAHQAEVISEP
jgi:hypothetical protein